jgi:hypothetical protein
LFELGGYAISKYVFYHVGVYTTIKLVACRLTLPKNINEYNSSFNIVVTLNIFTSSFIHQSVISKFQQFSYNLLHFHCASEYHNFGYFNVIFR